MTSLRRVAYHQQHNFRWRRVATVLTLSVLVFAFFRAHQSSASARTTTPLRDLAASLQPGTWAELTTNNINATLGFTGGASGNTFGFTENGVWDSVSGQFFFIGA